MIKAHDNVLIPEGWVLQKHLDTFSAHAGPYYFREDGSAGIGFVPEKHHLNLAGVIHGGALLTLADMSLFDICFRKVGMFNGLTVTLNSEFVGAGKPGSFVMATGDLIKAGGSLLFARGLISSEGETLMTFSGTLKRLRDK